MASVVTVIQIFEQGDCDSSSAYDRHQAHAYNMTGSGSGAEISRLLAYISEREPAST